MALFPVLTWFDACAEDAGILKRVNQGCVNG